jgi:hypothetical protein
LSIGKATFSPGPELRRVLVYRKIPGSLSSQAILPGVSALSVEEFLSERETF